MGPLVIGSISVPVTSIFLLFFAGLVKSLNYRLSGNQLRIVDPKLKIFGFEIFYKEFLRRRFGIFNELLAIGNPLVHLL